VLGQALAERNQAGRPGGCAELGQAEGGDATVAVHGGHRDGGRGEGNGPEKSVALCVGLVRRVPQRYGDAQHPAGDLAGRAAAGASLETGVAQNGDGARGARVVKLGVCDDRNFWCGQGKGCV